MTARRRRPGVRGASTIDGVIVPPMDTDVSESRWQRRIETLARFYGWTPWHAPAGGKAGRVDTEQTGKGFPDLALRRNSNDRGESYLVELGALQVPRSCEIVFAELKAPPRTGDREKWLKRHWTTEQRAWLDALKGAGIEAYLWCLPDDYDAMHGVLARGRYRVEPLWSPLLQEVV